jgi:hypothetical protein
MTGPGTAVAAVPGTGRIVGVDAARAVALAGMAAVHLLPLENPDGASTLVDTLLSGRAAALFAVLAGVGVALATGGAGPPRGAVAHTGAAAGLVVRGVLVGLLGLALAGLDPRVAVILAYYGLLFVVAVPLLRLGPRALGAGAVLACVVTPVLSHLLRTGLPRGPGAQADLSSLTEPGPLLLTLGVTGYYQVLTWTTYLLAGMAVGRLDLRDGRVGAALLGGGTVLAAAATLASAALLGSGGAAVLGADLSQRRYGTAPTDSWWWLAVAAPHSGTPADLAHTTGVALAVLGGALLIGRRAPGLLWLPAAVGAIPLSLYALHVLSIAAEPGSTGPAVLAGHLVVALLLGAAFRAARRRGPLEALTGAAGRTIGGRLRR